MSKLERDSGADVDGLPTVQQASVWKEDHWLVKLVRKLSPPASVLHFLRWPFLVLIVYGMLNYSGFCFKELRYLSDGEKVAKAIIVLNDERHLVRVVVNARTGKTDRIVETIPYESVAVFLKENPSCCVLIPKERIYGDHPPPGFFARISGDYGYAVAVKYIHKYREIPVLDDGDAGGVMREETIDTVVSSGNCGQLYECY